jgi:aminoglycoside phosphotransferase (APT) family kinase protein
MTDTLTDSLLCQLVTTHLPVDADRIRLEPIRTGKHNRSYYVRTDQGDAVLRIAPPQKGMIFYERDMMAQEPEIHALLRAETTVPVAEIYAYDDTHALIDRAYMLMERLPGCALSDVPHVSQRLYDGVLERPHRQDVWLYRRAPPDGARTHVVGGISCDVECTAG